MKDNQPMILNAIKQMERASRQDAGVVSLSQGIPFQQSDLIIRKAAIDAILTGKADQYSDPQGLADLRMLVVQALTEQGMDYESDEVVITAGAIEGLATVLHTVIGQKRDEVVMPVPVYSAYSRSVELAGGKVVPVCLDEANMWQLDVELVRNAITSRTAAILICNPNNPTGSVYPEQILHELAGLATKYGIQLIIDEVYGNMLYGKTAYFSPAQLQKYHKNVVRIVSFSKDFSLTGWRVGFLHTDRSRIAELVAVHDTLVNCAPVVSQYAALEALKQRHRILAANTDTYRHHRRVMANYLNVLKPHVSYVMPEGAYFFFVKLHDNTASMDFCLNLLRSQKLAVVPGDDFGVGGEGHVRLCFGRSIDAIHDGMQRLTKYLEKTNV